MTRLTLSIRIFQVFNQFFLHCDAIFVMIEQLLSGSSLVDIFLRIFSLENFPAFFLRTAVLLVISLSSMLFPAMSSIISSHAKCEGAPESSSSKIEKVRWLQSDRPCEKVILFKGITKMLFLFCLVSTLTLL